MTIQHSDLSSVPASGVTVVSLLESRLHMLCAACVFKYNTPVPYFSFFLEVQALRLIIHVLHCSEITGGVFSLARTSQSKARFSRKVEIRARRGCNYTAMGQGLGLALDNHCYFSL